MSVQRRSSFPELKYINSIEKLLEQEDQLKKNLSFEILANCTIALAKFVNRSHFAKTDIF